MKLIIKSGIHTLIYISDCNRFKEISPVILMNAVNVCC